jgi:hypothetical protein
MKNRLSLSLVVIALLCLAGWTGYARGQRSSSARQAWEYKVINCDMEELDRSGAVGWELVVSTTNQGCGLWLKRPK